MMAQIPSDLHGVDIKLKTTQPRIFLQCHQYADHAIILNRRRSVLYILHNLLSFSVLWKLQIQPDIYYDSNDGEIRCT